MEKLLFLREQLNVTQKAVADYIGLSRQAYAHYEFGDRYPDLKTLCKLADFFGVSVDYLLGRETCNLALSPPPSEYQRIYESQPRETQENILEFMKVFSKASIKTQLKILGRVEGWIFEEETKNLEAKNIKR
ncbi:MAG: helix-turn-helix domain-containing protein [Coriobacteriales bacterium]|jgi:putative prophage repressor